MTLIEMLRANGSWEADAAVTAIQVRDRRIEKLEAALRDLSDGWECCPVSQAMRRVARKAMESKND